MEEIRTMHLKYFIAIGIRIAAYGAFHYNSEEGFSKFPGNYITRNACRNFKLETGCLMYQHSVKAVLFISHVVCFFMLFSQSYQQYCATSSYTHVVMLLVIYYYVVTVTLCAFTWLLG